MLPRRFRLAATSAFVQNRSMASPLRVRLLGRPAFEADGAVIPFASRKALWLAAHAFYRRVPQPRADVASLLWGSDSARHSLGSLRVALTKLPPRVVDCLEVTRDTIGVARGAAFTIDAEVFRERCNAEDPAQQQSALTMYEGDLFQGCEEEVAPEFCDWVVAERARMRAMAHDVHLQVAQRLHAQGERARARDVVDAWLRVDPSSESMHKLLMSWLAPDQALTHYDVYRRARAVTHGAPPSDEMAGMADRLRHGSAAASRDAPAPTRLTAATSFFGRGDELAELRGLLADPSCRLLTLHGLGGVGKTRLAGALAEMEAGIFPGGVYAVALEGVHSPRLFAHTLARACGLSPHGAAAPLDLVASYLRERSALLVLDNLEHLLGADDAQPHRLPSQIATLLRSTGPQLKIITTSREPLRLQEEWLYALEGLRPDAAVQFFAQRARQAYIGFSLDAELPTVTRICETVEGLPLGLELAASWVRSVPCAEIAASLGERAGELRNRHVNRAARHDSLGAVVAYSWERLPPEQREALSGLGVLVGSFSREAAEQVAQAGVRSLSALTEKALLQRAGNGRWHVHEVVRQFAWAQPGASARVRSTRQAALQRQRDTFYIDYLRDAWPRIDGPQEQETMIAIEDEIANIRAAWRSRAEAGDLAALQAAAPAWFHFLECYSFLDEGLNAATDLRAVALKAGDKVSAGRALVRMASFQQFLAELNDSLASAGRAVEAFEAASPSENLARALMEQMMTLSHLGRLAESEAVGARAIAMAEALGHDTLLAQALTLQGIVIVRLGKAREARELQRRALGIALEHRQPTLLARVHNNLAMAENFLGEYGAAEAGYSAAYELWQDVRMTRFKALAMHNLGVVSQRVGDYARALERYRIALEGLKRVGDRKMISINLMSIGDSLVRIGRPGEARAPLLEALDIAERDGHALPVPYARMMLAHTEIVLGNPGEAARQVLLGFEEAERGSYTDVLAEGVVNTARLAVAMRLDSQLQALDWMRALAILPEASARVRDDARRILDCAADMKAPHSPEGERRGLKELVSEARSVAAAVRARAGSPASARRAHR
jgi:predicted ATPase/DNA-binding SARP family transcriptional activator